MMFAYGSSHCEKRLSCRFLNSFSWPEGGAPGMVRIQNRQERFSLTASMMFAYGSSHCEKRLSCRFLNSFSWPEGGAPGMVRIKNGRRGQQNSGHWETYLRLKVTECLK